MTIARATRKAPFCNADKDVGPILEGMVAEKSITEREDGKRYLVLRLDTGCNISLQLPKEKKV